MRIELDFQTKVVKVCQQVNFKKLMDFVQTLPEWEKWKVDTHSEINWQSPIIIKERDLYPWWPQNPPVQPNTPWVYDQPYTTVPCSLCVEIQE